MTKDHLHVDSLNTLLDAAFSAGMRRAEVDRTECPQLRCPARTATNLWWWLNGFGGGFRPSDRIALSDGYRAGYAAGTAGAWQTTVRAPADAKRRAFDARRALAA